MNKLSSQDRAALIRLASSLPAGDPNRKVILAGLSHGSKRVSDLSALEVDSLNKAIDKHSNSGNDSALAKNLATKFGLKVVDVIAYMMSR